MVVYVQSLVKCFLRFGTYGLQLLNDLIKRNYLEHFFIKTITLTTIYNQKSKFLENLYTHHLFVIFFMKNNQSLFYLFGPLCNTALPLHTQPFLFFLAILELNFLALLSSFMIPSGLISHSRKVKRPLHDTFVSRDRKNVAGQRFMEEKDTKLKIVQKFLLHALNIYDLFLFQNDSNICMRIVRPYILKNTFFFETLLLTLSLTLEMETKGAGTYFNSK